MQGMAYKGWNLSPEDRFEMDIYLKALEGTEEMKEKVVVVAVARKLLEVIGHILKSDKVYQYLECGKYAKNVLNCTWDLGREKT